MKGEKMNRVRIIVGVTVAVFLNVTVASDYVWEPFDIFPDGGDNWTSNWVQYSPARHILSIDTAFPIKDGGSYLTYRTLASAAVGINGVNRDFDPSFCEGVHTIKLNVRVDEFGAFFEGPDISDRMQIYGNTASSTGDVGANTTWCVMTTATVKKKNWHVYDGMKDGRWSTSYLKDTGLAVVPGGLYSIMVKVYPETLSYDLTMDDGTSSFTRLNNGFRTGSLDPSKKFCLGNKVRSASNGGSDCQLSYDSICIFPNGAYDPQPAKGQAQVPVTDVVLSWSVGMASAPDPNILEPISNPDITGHYVYLSAADDPTLPETPVFVTGPSYAVPFTLEKDATYYWRVDESINAESPIDDPNLIRGPLWSFQTELTVPVVWAGQNVVSYLQEGISTVQLQGNIEWKNPKSTVLWSVVSQPADSIVVFSDEAIEDPEVTLNMVGAYVLKLTAQDVRGGIGEDTMEIHVYADSCIAAQNILGYQPIPGDLNNDCQVNIADLAIFSFNWLKESFLLENYLY